MRDTILQLFQGLDMRKLTLTFVLALLMAAPLLGQHSHGGYPTPPEPAQHHISVAPGQSQRVTPKIDTVQLQREAREMLELSQSVQADIDSASRGLLSKDLSDKLKRIEKLSKKLRTELAP